MRNLPLTLVNASDATNQTSGPVDANQLINMSFQAIASATAAGTIKVQGSNDQPGPGQLRQNFTPTNWSDIPGASSVMAAGVAPMITLSNIACQYMRVVYTRTSGGTANIVVNLNAVGA